MRTACDIENFNWVFKEGSILNKEQESLLGRKNDSSKSKRVEQCLVCLRDSM